MIWPLLRHLSRSPRAHERATAVGFVVLACGVLRMLPERLGSGVVAGTEPCDTIPLVMSWTLGWNFDRFGAGLSGYWDAPIFHPTPATFALSEPMPLVAALVWPFHLLGGSLATCATLAVLLVLVLNAWFARRWLRRLGVDRSLGTLGGAIVVLLPFVHQELGVLALVPLWGALWMLTALVDLLGPGRRPQLRAGFELGLATAASWLCTEQLTFFTLLVLGPCAVALLRRRHLVATVPAALAVAGLVAAAAIVPVAVAHRRTLCALGLQRTDGDRRKGAAKGSQLWHVPWAGPLPLPKKLVARRPTARAFNPGPLRTSLAAVGCTNAFRRSRRRVVAMLATLIAGAIFVALGEHFVIASVAPAKALTIVPGFQSLRSVFRAVVLAQLGVIALAMLGLHAWRIRRRARRSRTKRSAVALGVVAALAFVELWPPAPRWTELPPDDVAWVRWLREQPDPQAAVAWLPFAPSGDVCDYEPTARMMVLGLSTGHPLVNGYSSYFPAHYDRVRRDTQTLPEPGALASLRDAGTRWVVARDDGPVSELDAHTLDVLGLVPAMRDQDAHITIYTLEKPTPDP